MKLEEGSRVGRTRASSKGFSCSSRKSKKKTPLSRKGQNTEKGEGQDKLRLKYRKGGLRQTAGKETAINLRGNGE